MSEQKKSPFARLDTSLLRSTATPSSANTTPQPETEKQENKETSSQENKETSNRENVETRKQVSKETSKRVFYPKVTYQLDPQVTDMLEDTKRSLRRAYGLKVSLAEIVEEGIRAICTDVAQNKETSKLVNKFSSKQGNTETS
jgi:flagellar biosynthesis component FlhA